MAYTRGRCTNFDYCSIADARRDAEVTVGDDFVCPECGKPLSAPPVAAGGNAVMFGLVGAGVLVLVGGAIYLGIRLGENGRRAAPQAPVAQMVQPAPATPIQAPVRTAAVTSSAPPVVPPPAPSETTLFRMSGSGDAAASLAPALAAAYLTDIGDTDIRTVPATAATPGKITGQRGDHAEAILVSGTDAADGFKALGAHGTDVVLASRRIRRDELTALSALGDLSAPDAEHVVALGALAIVAGPGNPLTSLSKAQVRDVFTGAITRWNGLGGIAAPIDIVTLDPASDLGASFATLALNGTPLAASAKKFPDPAAATDAIAADSNAIGVVDTRHIGGLHAIALAETGAAPLSPTDGAAVASEDYPLTYRIYLYAPATGTGIAKRFVDFAMSPEGQAVVTQAGFVSRTVKPSAPVAAPAPQTPLDRLRALVAGAKKWGSGFHFQPRSTNLDAAGQRDLDRVFSYLISNHDTGDKLIVVGFADNQGDPAQNLIVSQKRAEAVAALFTERGMKPGKVAGFGEDLPVANNNTEDGRNQNRRVEVYVLP